MNQTVVAIDRKTGAEPAPELTKTVAANQKAIDELPLNTGTWRVEGVPGLYVRCRAQTRSFFVQRRVRGALVKRIIGHEVTLKAARADAMKQWAKLKPKPPGGRKTLEQAFAEYLEQKDLGEKTREIYGYNLEKYLSGWKALALHDIGNDRAGVRALYHSLVKKHGKATAGSTMRTFSAVYRYARKADIDLPESPTVAVDLPHIKARDWALSADELKAWWHTVKTGGDGNKVQGVKTLGAIKRTWWLTCLLTGARRASIEALEWTDIDLDRKTIRFRVTKGGRPYMAPAADELLELLTAYRDGGEVPPSNWVFPSPAKPDRHLTNVRDDKRGVASAHHMRHTYRTVLAELGATTDQARLLMGHSMGGDVSRDYITAPLLIESLRPIANAVAGHYHKIVGW